MSFCRELKFSSPVIFCRLKCIPLIFKLIHLTEFIVRNIKGVRHWVAKIQGLENLSFCSKNSNLYKDILKYPLTNLALVRFPTQFTRKCDPFNSAQFHAILGNWARFRALLRNSTKILPWSRNSISNPVFLSIIRSPCLLHLRNL